MDTDTQRRQIAAKAIADIDATKEINPRQILENFIENTLCGEKDVYHRKLFCNSIS